MATSIIPPHVLTGCDHNSGFYGASKKLIADRIQSSEEARDLLSACGRELPAPEEVINDLERFVIRYIYCDSKHETLADVRAAKWRGQKKKNTIRLAPDSDSLRLHLERANYLTYLQKHFDLQIHPSPVGHGWHLVDGMCLLSALLSPHFRHPSPCLQTRSRMTVTVMSATKVMTVSLTPVARAVTREVTHAITAMNDRCMALCSLSGVLRTVVICVTIICVTC